MFKDQVLVKKSCELQIIKCIFHIFQEFFSEFNYLYNFLSYAVIQYSKREKTYCTIKAANRRRKKVVNAARKKKREKERKKRERESEKKKLDSR